MKIQNKKELQQVASNHSFDINIKESIILYKIFTVKPYFFLAINTSLASDNPLNLRYNLERMWKLIIITDDKIRDEKLQFDINREVTNIFPLSSGKINNNEYLTSEKISFSFQNQVKDRAKFTY